MQGRCYLKTKQVMDEGKYTLKGGRSESYQPFLTINFKKANRSFLVQRNDTGTKLTQQHSYFDNKTCWTCSGHNVQFITKFRTQKLILFGYIFFNPQLFLSGFKNFHVHTYPYSYRICPRHVSGFTLIPS